VLRSQDRFDSRRGIRHGDHAVYVPRADPDHPFPRLQREGDLGERPVGAADRDQGVRGAHHQRVPGLAEPRRDRGVDEPVGRGAVGARQDAHRQRTRLLRPTARGLHHTAEAAAHHHHATRTQLAADRLGGLALLGSGLARA
jgi:hypothetical protein